MTPGQWVMVALGVLVLAGGGLVVARSRRPTAVEEARIAGEDPPRARFWVDRWIDRFDLSTPTVIVIGGCLVIMGYHLAAWALPAGTIAVRLDPSLGWLMPVVGGGLVWISRWLDRLDRHSEGR